MLCVIDRPRTAARPGGGHGHGKRPDLPLAAPCPGSSSPSGPWLSDLGTIADGDDARERLPFPAVPPSLLWPGP